MGGAHYTVQEKRNACRGLVGKPSNKISLEDLGVDGMMLLKWNLNRMGEGRLESCGSGKVQVVGCSEKFERGHPIVYYQIRVIYYIPSIHNIHQDKI